MAIEFVKCMKASIESERSGSNENWVHDCDAKQLEGGELLGVAEICCQASDVLGSTGEKLLMSQMVKKVLWGP